MDRISVITPTFRREDLLARCVESVLAQEVDAEIEHIIVNDSGEPLKSAPWRDDPRVQVMTTYRTERSVARNTGAAVSQGNWLYFLDDDDYPLPGAFAALLRLAQAHPQAVHLYGGYEIMDETERQTSTIQPHHQGVLFPILFAGETFPFQSSWLRRAAFFQAGGFDPHLVPTEDVDLLQRVCRLGPSAGTREVVARIRVNHPSTTTTAEDKATRLFRKMPDLWLQLPDTFSLLREHTRSSPYWAGRCARTCFITAIRHLQKGGVATALSRSLLAGRLSGPHLLSSHCWRGLRRASAPA